jgi:hypothetical protein
MSTARDWFGVRLVVECQVGKDPPAKRTYEDRLVVVRAGSEGQAGRKAERLTRAGVERYRNVFGETVTWRFKEVIDIYPILDDELADGTETYSAFMNYRFYRSLANKGELGAWPAYVRAHPRADASKVTVGQVLAWNARRSPKLVKKILREAPGTLGKGIRRGPTKRVAARRARARA